MADTTLTALLEQLLRDIRGAWRYRWYALGAAWLIFIAGWAIVASLPDVYEANARVFVDTSSRLRDVLGTIAYEPDVDSRVNTVRQAMLGRPQLEKVANETGLANRAQDADERERLITGLLDKIQIAAGRSTRDRNLFQITYQDTDRDMSVAVVSTLLNSFVDDVINQKQRGTAAAQKFLQEQITHYSDQLAAADSRLADFKKKNVGLMPGESGDYFRNLQTELAALDQVRADLRVAQSKREELTKQLGGETPIVPGDSASVAVANAPGRAGGDVDTRIATLEKTLGDLLLRFTDSHPDVIAIKEQLAALRARRDEELAQSGNAGGLSANNPVYQSIQMALNQANVEVAALNAKLADGQRKVARLQASLDTMPEVEAELARLTRDYANTKTIYDNLVAQLERERLVDQGDEREVINFEVIDPPMADIDPVAPRRLILLLAVLILGLAGGGGLAFFLHSATPVFVDAAQLRRISGLPVLGAVSLVLNRQERAAQHTELAFFYGLAVSLLVAAVLAVIFRDASSALAQQLLQSMRT